MVRQGTMQWRAGIDSSKFRTICHRVEANTAHVKSQGQLKFSNAFNSFQIRKQLLVNVLYTAQIGQVITDLVGDCDNVGA